MNKQVFIAFKLQDNFENVMEASIVHSLPEDLLVSDKLLDIIKDGVLNDNPMAKNIVITCISVLGDSNE